MQRTPVFRTAVAAALGALAVTAASAGAQTPAAPATGTITAVGTASVKPTPTDATSNGAIATAVREAGRRAIPLAVGDARARATLLAAAGNLTLGAVLGISDPMSPGFFGGYFGQDGTFGPGKFCGRVSRYRTTRVNGVPRRKLIKRSRSCRVPPVVTATEVVTFTTGS